MKRILLVIAAMLLSIGAFAQDQAAPVLVTVPEIDRPTQAELWQVLLNYGTDALATSEEGVESAAWTQEPYCKIIFRGISGPIENGEAVHLDNAWGDPAYANDRWIGKLVVTGNLAKALMTNSLNSNVRSVILAFLANNPAQMDKIVWERV